MLPTLVLFHIHHVVKTFHNRRAINTNAKNSFLLLTVSAIKSKGIKAKKTAIVIGCGGQAIYIIKAATVLNNKYLKVFNKVFLGCESSEKINNSFN